jgi:hypothetical protein
MKGGAFLDQIYNYQYFKKEPAPWSKSFVIVNYRFLRMIDSIKKYTVCSPSFLRFTGQNVRCLWINECCNLSI